MRLDDHSTVRSWARTGRVVRIGLTTVVIGCLAGCAPTAESSRRPGISEPSELADFLARSGWSFQFVHRGSTEIFASIGLAADGKWVAVKTPSRVSHEHVAVTDRFYLDDPGSNTLASREELCRVERDLHFEEVRGFDPEDRVVITSEIHVETCGQGLQGTTRREVLAMVRQPGVGPLVAAWTLAEGESGTGAVPPWFFRGGEATALMFCPPGDRVPGRPWCPSLCDIGPAPSLPPCRSWPDHDGGRTSGAADVERAGADR